MEKNLHTVLNLLIYDSPYLQMKASSTYMKVNLKKSKFLKKIKFEIKKFD